MRAASGPLHQHQCFSTATLDGDVFELDFTHLENHALCKGFRILMPYQRALNNAVWRSLCTHTMAHDLQKKNPYITWPYYVHMYK